MIHGIEYYDAAGSDWDVVCYLDTLNGSGNFYGWATSNTLDDRYPSVFSTAGRSYIAYQGDVGSGNLDILFNYSLDYGQNWAASMIDIAPEPEPEVYPRVSGYDSHVGVDYFFNANYVRFNYSVLYGQAGTWLPSGEFATDNTTASPGYHAAAIQYTPSYYYASWEDLRDYASDSINLYACRRVTPIGIDENSSAMKTDALRACPNPFANSTSIRFNLDHAARVDLSIYDASGRLVRNLIRARAQAGDYAFAWDRRDQQGQIVPNGVYFGRLITDRGTTTQNLILIK